MEVSSIQYQNLAIENFSLILLITPGEEKEEEEEEACEKGEISFGVVPSICFLTFFELALFATIEDFHLFIHHYLAPDLSVVVNTEPCEQHDQYFWPFKDSALFVQGNYSLTY